MPRHPPRSTPLSLCIYMGSLYPRSHSPHLGWLPRLLVLLAPPFQSFSLLLWIERVLVSHWTACSDSRSWCRDHSHTEVFVSHWLFFSDILTFTEEPGLSGSVLLERKVSLDLSKKKILVLSTSAVQVDQILRRVPWKFLPLFLHTQVAVQVVDWVEVKRLLPRLEQTLVQENNIDLRSVENVVVVLLLKEWEAYLSDEGVDSLHHRDLLLDRGVYWADLLVLWVESGLRSDHKRHYVSEQHLELSIRLSRGDEGRKLDNTLVVLMD